MLRTHARAATVMPVVALALVVATLIALPAPSHAGAAPVAHPPRAAAALLASDGTVVTAPFPGVDRHGWSGAAGTAGAPTSGDEPGAAPADLPAPDGGPADVPVRAPDGGLRTRSIIGTDDLVRVADVGAYPARATGLITRQGFPLCTGALIGPDTVLTAGHCLHEGPGGQGWMTGIAFHTRLFTDDHQACAARAGGLMAFRGWVEQGDERADVGVVKLTCALGETVGWLGVAPTTRDLTGAEVTLQGFPGERLAQLWMSEGPILVDDRDGLVFYDHDTLNGMSGAALQRDLPPRGRSCAGACVVAVHAYGLHGEGLHAAHNHGARLTPAQAAALRTATWPA